MGSAIPSKCRGLRVLVALVSVWLALLVPSVRAATPPEQDPFYSYEGSKSSLKQMAPGTVLKTRTVPFHIAGIQLPVTAVQLLYRSTSELGQPTVNVTSVLLAPLKLSNTVLSYQSFYDSLNTEDDPSYAISGGIHSGGEIAQAESVLITPALLAGETVVIPDTEGEEADFSAGPVYGYNTLDSLRAALSSPATGLTSTTKIGLAGYSGGAIATGWPRRRHQRTPLKSTPTSSAHRWAACSSTRRTT